MDINFSQNEARIIGCLLEKEVTTPDQYPLTLNALTTACNQKTNREPVLALTEAEVMDSVEELKEKRLINELVGFGSRVPKYKHRFCNTEFGSLQLSKQEFAVICVLLLRGAQTAGELRTRTNRLCDFKDVKEAEEVLTKLAEHEKGPYVVKLPKEPGKRDCRYMHLFSGEVDISTLAASTSVSNSSASASRIEQLELEVQALKQELAELKETVQMLTE
ncbi:YceH family protein [Photobacterium damselae]|uniref:YceH family protein n=1 Tax=Photobacterium damselae TaxID=38293 RepID=UPI001302E07D|nr:DUF480 domain-containing protein [Photobacterium damselae]